MNSFIEKQISRRTDRQNHKSFWIDVNIAKYFVQKLNLWLVTNSMLIKRKNDELHFRKD